jgi:hypothetical protein
MRRILIRSAAFGYGVVTSQPEQMDDRLLRARINAFDVNHRNLAVGSACLFPAEPPNLLFTPVKLKVGEHP